MNDLGTSFQEWLGETDLEEAEMRLSGIRAEMDDALAVETDSDQEEEQPDRFHEADLVAGSHDMAPAQLPQTVSQEREEMASFFYSRELARKAIRKWLQYAWHRRERIEKYRVARRFSYLWVLRSALRSWQLARERARIEHTRLWFTQWRSFHARVQLVRAKEDRAHHFYTQKRQRRALVSWRLFTLRRTSVRAKQALALNHWAAVSMYRAWRGWAEYHERKRENAAMYARAQQIHQQRVITSGLRRWLEVGLSRRQQFLEAQADESARRARHVYFVAVRCGMHWRQLTRRNRLQRLQEIYGDAIAATSIHDPLAHPPAREKSTSSAVRSRSSSNASSQPGQARLTGTLTTVKVDASLPASFSAPLPQKAWSSARAVSSAVSDSVGVSNEAVYTHPPLPPSTHIELPSRTTRRTARVPAALLNKLAGSEQPYVHITHPHSANTTLDSTGPLFTLPLSNTHTQTRHPGQGHDLTAPILATRPRQSSEPARVLPRRQNSLGSLSSLLSSLSTTAESSRSTRESTGSNASSRTQTHTAPPTAQPQAVPARVSEGLDMGLDPDLEVAQIGRRLQQYAQQQQRTHTARTELQRLRISQPSTVYAQQQQQQRERVRELEQLVQEYEHQREHRKERILAMQSRLAELRADV